MRYAIFTDIHANLEALEAVLAKIDEIAQQEPIDQIWFLGDLVGYGPNPNECILKLRERTDVIIAGNHDWAAVGKIDLEDFSAAARISAEWTSEQLTQEHHDFLANLPERLEIGDVTLVHGSPYGPLWEYLTSDILAERSFQCFNTHYCFVGHTHVPVIFQQPDPIANTPTLPLEDREPNTRSLSQSNGIETHADAPAPVLSANDAGVSSFAQAGRMEDEDEETEEMITVHPPAQQSALAAKTAESAYKDPESGKTVTEDEANAIIEQHMQAADQLAVAEDTATDEGEQAAQDELLDTETEKESPDEPAIESAGITALEHVATEDEAEQPFAKTPEPIILNAEDRLNTEIEELLTLLGLSQSMIKVTNEMITPPEGHWEPPEGYRAIVNPGGVGQPRDGDPRAAFMIYDTERGFEFYRIPYALEKTQEKIIKAGLPQYLAVRLAYGR